MNADANALAALVAANLASGAERLPGGETRALNQAFLVVTYRPDGRIDSANFQFLRLFGCNLGEIVGHDASRFFSKTAGRERHAELWARLANGLRQTDINLWIGSGGREIWLESRYIPLLSADRRIEGVVQIAEDITERLGREAEDRSQIAAIHATQAVAHLSLDGRIEWVNDLFLDATGYRREEVLGQPHQMLVDPAEHDSPAYAGFRAALRAGQPRSGEFRRLRRDGSDLWLQAVYTPILDPAGRPIRIVKYATDITAGKLRQADEQSQVRAIHKSNCVVTFDMHGAILDANELFLAATGYRLEEVRGRHHRMSSSRPMPTAASTRASGTRCARAGITPACTSAWAATAASCGCKPPTTRSSMPPASR